MRRIHPAVLACAAVLLAAAAHAQSRNVTLLAHVDNYSTYASCCAYIHSDGREYVAVGANSGTSILRLTDPSNPVEVGFIPGPSSSWREMKQYRNYIYVVSEGTGSGRGLQIIRMTNPDAPVLARTVTTWFTTAHSVSCDTTRAILYCNGTSASAMVQLSLANPEQPTYLGSYTKYYVHDMHVRGVRGYLANIYDGRCTIVDLSTPGTFPEIVSWKTPGNFTHNCWTTPDSHYIFTTDENTTGRLAVWDISTVTTPTLVADYRGLPAHIVHNVHLKADTAFVAYYTAGTRLFDITDPSTPVEFGYYDTYNGSDGGYEGNWAVEPYFPSGIFVSTDISNGVYVFRSNPVYTTIRGVVSDANTAAPLPGASVTLEGTPYSMVTYPTGMYGFAPDAGTYNVVANAYAHWQKAQPASLSNGFHSVVNMPLIPIPTGSVTGTVRRSSDNAVLANVAITVPSTPLNVLTSTSGTYSLPKVPEGNNSINAELPGYAPGSTPMAVVAGQGSVVDFTLAPAAFYDDAEIDRGWSLSAAGDDATGGLWIRANPIGTESGATQPEDDHTPAGTICFVTANGTVGGNVGEADVDNGKTTLTSPAFDLTALADPVLSWWQWYSDDAAGDTFVVDLSNDGGATWTRVRSIVGSHEFWEREVVRVGDYLAPTSAMKLRFLAQDQGAQETVEAAVDDVEYYDVSQATSIVDRVGPSGARLSLGAVRPNPSRAQVTARLDLPAPAPLSVQVFDTRGRLVRTLFVGMREAGAYDVRWDGREKDGRAAPSGVYTIRAEAGARTVHATVVRTP